MDLWYGIETSCYSSLYLDVTVDMIGLPSYEGIFLWNFKEICGRDYVQEEKALGKLNSPRKS